MVRAWARTGGEECAGPSRFAAERDEQAGILAARGFPMLNQLLHDDLAQAIVSAQNSPLWARARKLLLVMLGLWLSYFLLVNWFVHSLNKIAVPVIGIPLGTYLAIQGAAIVFAVALFRFARTAE
jgi:putative solute:sodium symporter small subunit